MKAIKCVFIVLVVMGTAVAKAKPWTGSSPPAAGWAMDKPATVEKMDTLVRASRSRVALTSGLGSLFVDLAIPNGSANPSRRSSCRDESQTRRADAAGNTDFMPGYGRLSGTAKAVAVAGRPDERAGESAGYLTAKVGSVFCR